MVLVDECSHSRVFFGSPKEYNLSDGGSALDGNLCFFRYTASKYKTKYESAFHTSA